MTRVIPHRPDLAQQLGDGPALLLQQLIFHLRSLKGQIHQGLHWIYKTAETLATELGSSIRSIRRWIRTLVDQGLILRERLSASNWYQANWFTLTDKGRSLLENADFTWHDRSRQVGTIDSDKVARSYLRDPSLDYSPTPSLSQRESCSDSLTPEQQDPLELPSVDPPDQDPSPKAPQLSTDQPNSKPSAITLIDLTQPPPWILPGRGDLDDKFLSFVTEKAKRLPTPPEFPDACAKALIKRHGSALWQEYKQQLHQIRHQERLAQQTAATETLTLQELEQLDHQQHTDPEPPVREACAKHYPEPPTKAEKLSWLESLWGQAGWFVGRRWIERYGEAWGLGLGRDGPIDLDVF